MGGCSSEDLSLFATGLTMQRDFLPAAEWHRPPNPLHDLPHRPPDLKRQRLFGSRDRQRDLHVLRGPASRARKRRDVRRRLVAARQGEVLG